MRIHFISLWVLSIVLGLATLARADVVATPHVEAELVSDTLEVAPGTTFWIALRQKIIPGWHTYWKNAGDSGEATKIEWDLPEGVQAGDIHWPVPEKIPVGPLINYGYKDEIFLLTELRVPDAASPGALPIQAHVEWLVCEEICIPEEVDLQLDLRVAEGATFADLLWAPKLKDVRNALPATIPWDVTATAQNDRVRISFEAASWKQAFENGRITRLEFFPAQDGLIRYAEPQQIDYGETGFSLDVAGGYKVRDQGRIPGDRVEGLLRIEEIGPAGGERIQSTYAFSARVDETAAIYPTRYNVPGSDAGDVSFFKAFVFAFVGGLLLNLMPCVFPVLSMKALSFLSHVHGHDSEMRRQGLAYGAGVLLSFAALAILLLVLRAGGEQIGWGFQLQSPIFIAVMAYILFVVGLNLLGLFDVGERLMGVGSDATRQGGTRGALMTGVLAVIVATPCTAPFMGAAMGYALFQPAFISLTIFLALGLGLAAPFMVLSFVPQLAHVLPKPGPWMVRFKQVLAVPMFATVLWLLWVLSQQATSASIGYACAGLALLTVAAWAYGKRQRGSGFPLQAGVSLLGILLAFGLITQISARPLLASSDDSYGPAFEPYSLARLNELRTSGMPVFVNFTAAWCITCLVNERVVFSQEAIRTRFEQGDIAYLKGDWTNEDPLITDALSRYGRAGVPLYVLYPPGGGGDGDGKVLPQVLTPSAFLDAINDL